VNVYPVKSLIDVSICSTAATVSAAEWIRHRCWLRPTRAAGDFKEVRGQFTAKRALEIACAGDTNPDDRAAGLGQTMLAKRVSASSALTLRSARDNQDPQRGGAGRRFRLVSVRPFRCHTIHF